MGLRTLAGTLAKQSLNLAAVPVGAAVGFQTGLRIACHRQPMPMPRQFSSLLEHPVRMAYRNPTALIERCGIGHGETAVDLGCGIGTFTIEMARRVGETGTVHAVDIQPSFLHKAETRLHHLGLYPRVHFHLASAANLPLPSASVDVVTMIATSGEWADPIICIDESFRILKPGGRLLVSEELADPGYVSARTLRRWLTDGGFELVVRDGNLFCYSELYLKPTQTIEMNAY